MSIGFNLRTIEDEDQDREINSFKDVVDQSRISEVCIASPLEVNGLIVAAVSYAIGTAIFKEVLLLSGATVEELEGTSGSQFIEGLLHRAQEVLSTGDTSNAQLLARFPPSLLGKKLARLLAETLTVTGKPKLAADLKELLEDFRKEVTEDAICEAELEQRLDHFAKARALGGHVHKHLLLEVRQDFELGSKLLENQRDIDKPLQLDSTVQPLKYLP